MIMYMPEDAGQPPSHFAPYLSTRARSPREAPIRMPQTLTETTGPAACWDRLMGQAAADLTAQGRGAPIGQRITVQGRVLDEHRRPVPETVIEIWQANAAGRYIHVHDQWDAPLDPNFKGAGRVISDSAGRFSFTTIKPGAYPWRNHRNAWRPAHIHLSLLGPAFATRLVTQLYFPDDPLMDLDPIANAVPMPFRGRMVARLDMSLTQEAFALGYLFDIVLRGAAATPFDDAHHD